MVKYSQGVLEAVMNRHWLSTWMQCHEIIIIVIRLPPSMQWKWKNEKLSEELKESPNLFATISHDWNQLGSHFSSTLKIFAINFSFFHSNSHSKPQKKRFFFLLIALLQLREISQSCFLHVRWIFAKSTTISSFFSPPDEASSGNPVRIYMCTHLIERQVINMQKKLISF